MKDELNERRVQRLVTLARQFADTDGKGPAAFDALRREVASEVLREAAMPIARATLTALKGQPARDYLVNTVRYCRECFHADDRTVASLVIPLGLRLSAPREGIAKMTAGKPVAIEQLERFLTNRLNVKRVHLDYRLYTARDIASLTPAQLRDHLHGLETRNAQLPRVGPGRVLISQPDPEPESRYLIGAAIYGAGEVPDLESQAIQAPLQEVLWAMSVPFVFDQLVYFREEIRCEVACRGVFHRSHGLEAGEAHYLREALERYISKTVAHTPKARLYLTEDRPQGMLRLSNGMRTKGADLIWEIPERHRWAAWRRLFDTQFAECVASGLLPQGRSYFEDPCQIHGAARPHIDMPPGADSYDGEYYPIPAAPTPPRVALATTNS